MFKSLKLYTDMQIDLDELIPALIDFGYKKQKEVLEEGDFSRRGEILDIYPATFECPVRTTFDFNKITSLNTIDLACNRVIWKHQMIIILPLQRAYKRIVSSFDEESPLDLFVELKKGDYVVHTKHGIGRYLEIQKITREGITKDYFVIEYAGYERLFVPVSDGHLIQKFIGLGNRIPKINRIGTNEWQALKRRVRKGIFLIAYQLLEIQAKRLVMSGFAFSPDAGWQEEFEKGFAFTETPDQIKAAGEVKKDMQEPHPMDRLLCGDVGYGKTEVAMRAAFKAVMDNKQAAILVPTTILAEQHYQNFLKRLKDFPVRTQMLSRFVSGAKQQEIIKGIKSGAVDIIIGTHRLLSDDIQFKDLGLLIIDEEQRFGVKAKEKIKSLRLTVDILTLTATPIPRTLYMGLMGAKDISVINTPPARRMPVSTYVVKFHQDLIKQAIEREHMRNGQVFFIHNRIKDISRIYQLLKQLLPQNYRISYAHGQMHEKELEDIMLSFLNKEIDCLICTTIIQSGIDIPAVNTIIINDAHTFGLPDLHQLRGRVGRFDLRAYAYFLIPESQILTGEAQRRLEAIKEYSQLGSGFKIAMEDMEIRGAGNILGVQQHGFIQSVGFDLYCRLLRETINAIKKNRPVSPAIKN